MSSAARRRSVVIVTVAGVALLGGLSLAFLATRAQESRTQSGAVAPMTPVAPPATTAVPAGEQPPTPPPPQQEEQSSEIASEKAPPRPAPARPAPKPAPPKPVETLVARLTDPGGATVSFFREGMVRVSGVPLSPELSRDLYRIYVLERVPAPASGASGEAEPAIRLTSPDPGDAGLETTTPVFRWTAVPGVEQYTFVLERLADARTGEWQPVAGASGQVLTAPQRVVPVDAPLLRGGRYRWRVEATREGEALRSATIHFRVLDASELQLLNEARDRYGNTSFLLGPYYEALGLHEEAIWEYLKLARANPTSPQAQRALENAKLRAERHRQGEG